MWRWQSVSERVWTRTSACPRSDGRCSGACAWRPGSSSSSLSQSLSFLLSSGQPVQCTWILTGQFVCLCVITLQLYLCRHIKEIYIIHFVTHTYRVLQEITCFCHIFRLYFAVSLVVLERYPVQLTRDHCIWFVRVCVLMCVYWLSADGCCKWSPCWTELTSSLPLHLPSSWRQTPPWIASLPVSHRTHQSERVHSTFVWVSWFLSVFQATKVECVVNADLTSGLALLFLLSTDPLLLGPLGTTLLLQSETQWIQLDRKKSCHNSCTHSQKTTEVTAVFDLCFTLCTDK